MRRGLWVSRRSCCPRLKLSKLLLKFPLSLCMKSTQGGTSLSDWVCSAALGSVFTLLQHLLWECAASCGNIQQLSSNEPLNVSGPAALTWAHEGVMWCQPTQQPSPCCAHLAETVKSVLLSDSWAALVHDFSAQNSVMDETVVSSEIRVVFSLPTMAGAPSVVMRPPGSDRHLSVSTSPLLLQICPLLSMCLSGVTANRSSQSSLSSLGKDGNILETGEHHQRSSRRSLMMLTCF